ncbi:hypothetical protein RM844_17500 [Streptomyces sp. DSM 44915]|uniref:Uncharacterized protein n=1 Tax=Streptomyces chisholmiae TaxID=3075540 RepID=A0ABU2JSW7_9ACTN|nr:hypothetical protein [Streptomyces sp. DSM 44915]MDT0268080.1 hypothetical protein [Streptomyces sp. DSM 44915]
MAESAGAGFAVTEAMDELLGREALTVGVALDAAPAEIQAHLAEATADHPDTRQPTPQEASLLADLELTFSMGNPDDEVAMRDLAPEDPRDSSLTVNFGGRDVLGLKHVEELTYLRIGAEALVADVLGGDEAAVAAAERFTEDAGQLPESLTAAATGLRGDWVEVDPFQYPAYAEAVTRHGEVTPEAAHALAASIEDGDALLQPQAEWDVVGGLRAALDEGATTHHEGERRGAERVTLRMTAEQARAAIDPLLTLLNEHTTRYGLPPVVDAATDPAAEVEVALTVRHGVLSEATFDLAGLGQDDQATGPLPLRLSLAGGAALSLTAPESAGPVSPEDLTVALLYLQVRDEQRTEDEHRADLPGPMQP